jgi:hypothetical protein
VTDKPGREPPPAFVQFERDHVDELRTTFVWPRPRVEEVSDVLREWRVGRVGGAGCMQ